VRASAAAIVAGTALLAGLAVLAGGGSWRLALRVLLDLLTAAGLLRLTADQAWAQVAEAAAVVALRVALWRVLAAGAPPAAGSHVTSPAPPELFRTPARIRPHR
jgi:hypothetical protein